MAEAWSERSDGDLLLHIQEGSHHAFAVLVRRHSRRFYSLAYRYLNSRELAEDMVQEAFLKLWERPGMWDSSRNNAFTTWFYRIIVNLCLDNIKKKKPLALSEDFQVVDVEKAQDQKMIEQQQNKVLEQEILNLPERQRTALNLCFYEELSNKEAAEIMGVNLKALQSLLMRAKENLRAKMGNYLRGGYEERKAG